jgi:hypothetical protein
MILRRIIAHFRKQEWTAIGIDFVIVVLGVFIGIQVASWNEARVGRERAHAYLERIESDLQTDLRNYRDRIAFWGVVSDYGREGLAYAETGNAADTSQWRLLLAYFQASQVAEYYTTSATWDELKSAGELHLIADVELRNALASYYTNAANPVLTERPAYRVHVRGIVPIDVQDHIWSQCFRTTPSGEQALVDCPSPISEARAAAIVNAIRSDRALMNELRYWMSTMTVAANIGDDRVANATQLSSAVAVELNR